MLPHYEGAVRGAIQAWASEHEDELKDGTEVKQPARSLTPEQLRSDPRLGAAPAAGQMAPIFDIRTV